MIKNKENLPINDSIWVIFNLFNARMVWWFDSKEEANIFKKDKKTWKSIKLSKPIKYCRDF